MSKEQEVILNFSVYHKLILKLIKYISLDLSSNQCSTRSERRKIIIKDAIFLFYLLNGALYYIFTIKNLLERPEAKYFTIVLCSGTSGVVILAKCLTIFIHKAEITAILSQMDKKYRRRHLKFDYQYYQRFFERFVQTEFAFLFISLFLLFLTPLLELLLTGRKTFPVISPFYGKTPPSYIYSLTLLWSFWAFGLPMLIGMVSELVLYGFIVVISIEFEILSKRYQHLKGQLAIDKELRSLVDHHNELSSHVMKLENIFSFPLFCNFIASSFVICFTAFQASIATEVAESFQMAFYCVISLIQILLQCYLGQVLKTASERLICAIYDCGWEEQLRKLKVTKGLVLIMRKAQNPTMITTMKFADITLYQFSTVRYSLSCHTIFFYFFFFFRLSHTHILTSPSVDVSTLERKINLKVNN